MPKRANPSDLSVSLELPSGFERFVASRLRVSLIDITLADTSARVLTSKTVEQVLCEPGGILQIVLPHTTASLAASGCSLQAHASRSGERAWARGDLATTQSWPVRSGASAIRVQLSLI